MTSIQLFTTENLDLAAFLICMGYSMNILRPTCGTRALFEFVTSSGLVQAIINYESGSPTPAKRLLNTRSRLYREASNVVKREGGRHGN